MHRNHDIRVHPPGGYSGILGAHGIVIADGKQSNVYMVQIPNDRLHIVGQRRISGKIDGFAVQLHQKTAGHAKIR